MKLVNTTILFTLFQIYYFINLSSARIFSAKEVDTLLREIRARLQEKEENVIDVDSRNEKILNEKKPESVEDIDVEGSGSGEEMEGSGMSEAPLSETVREKDGMLFPTPEPIFNKHAILKRKEDIEEFTLSNLKKEAPTTLKEKYDQNPVATKQMLQGLDIHGASGGYHRALTGGYLPPTKYDPFNVNWHSYGDEGVKMKNKAIEVYRRVLVSNL